MSEQKEWSVQLRGRLRETIYSFFSQSWKPFDEERDRGFASDVRDAGDKFESLEILYIERTEPSMKIYATVLDKQVDSVREIQNLVHSMLSLVDEDFFLFVPMHTEEELRFWFLTGTMSHEHEGLVIIKRADIPQVIY